MGGRRAFQKEKVGDKGYNEFPHQIMLYWMGTIMGCIDGMCRDNIFTHIEVYLCHEWAEPSLLATTMKRDGL
jgi:hypothetical protein